jgi:hypothetical protein
VNSKKDIRLELSENRIREINGDSLAAISHTQSLIKALNRLRKTKRLEYEGDLDRQIGELSALNGWLKGLYRQVKYRI